MAPDAANLQFLTFPSSGDQALGTLAAPVARWFAATFARPTLAQRFAWPAFGRGDNLLLCAPTGSGKTLAAFLPIASRLLANPEPGLSCLYLATLKALGRDAGKNLCRLFRQLAGLGAARIRVGLRTGDTSQRLRRRQWDKPPHILLTTPESLAVLLTHPRADDFFGGLRWVIVDEVHALAGNKRGADLALSLERLEELVMEREGKIFPKGANPLSPLSLACGNLFFPAISRGGEGPGMRGQSLNESLLAPLTPGPSPPADFARDGCSLRRRGERGPASLQRIGLSATCSPPQIAARFLVGTGRPCTIAQVADRAPLEIRIEPLPAEIRGLMPPARPAGFMARLVERLKAEICRNRTTLIFTNIRSIAERLTWTLKRRFPLWARHIAVHHSSLAADRRRAVERRLKKGMLRVVVSSTSLELGIDIGSVDGVVFVHPPGGAARLLQRLGRSGHRPGQPRRGLFLTSGPAELLEATVTAASSRAGQLEPLTVPSQPLDVLCQQLAGMAMTRWWGRDKAFALVRRAYPFRDLTEDDFDRCLAYLTGRHSDGRSWLPARLRWQRDCFAIANPATTQLLRRNLGTILNEEPRSIRLILSAPNEEPRSAVIGSLDHAYADRLHPGDRFVLDGRCWQFRRLEERDLLVDEVTAYPLVPRWTGAGWFLSRELAARLYLFRQEAAEALRDPKTSPPLRKGGPGGLTRFLREEYKLGEAAAAELVRFFLHQETVSEIPDAHTLLVEWVPSELGIDYYFHTPLNRPGNDALARLLVWRLGRVRGWSGQTVVADLGFMLALPGCRPVAPEAWRSLLTQDDFDADMDEALRDCPSLRERFARVAMTGLMVLRQPLGGRRKVGGHDWAQRRLFDQVRQGDPDFVLLRQAEREFRAETCDVEAARSLLADLPRQQVKCRRLAGPSPFAHGWTQPAEITGEGGIEPDQALDRLHVDLMRMRVG